MTTAIFLIGLPASGKSTYRNQLIKRFPNAVVVSSDDIIEEESSKEGMTYNQGFQKFIKFATNKLDEIVSSASRDNLPIIWDQTNLTAKQRKQKLAKIPKHYQKIAVVVKCKSVDEHFKRLNSRPGKTIPETVIRSMKASYEVPMLKEGFDAIRYVET